MQKFVFLFAFMAAPFAHASQSSECMTYALGPQYTVTANADDYNHVEIEDLNAQMLEDHLNKPIVFREPKTHRLQAYRAYVGPVMFHRPSVFSLGRQKIIDEVIKSARPRLGLTYRSRILTSFSSSSEWLNEEDLKNPREIDAKDIKSIEIFYAHPMPTTFDVQLAQEIAAAYEKKYHSTPDIHIYTVADTEWGRLVGHYSVQR
jgi:hypothetical protein